MLIDCESCIARVFETGIVEQVELVLMEMDQFGIPPRSVHYGQYSKRLRDMGFVRIWFSHDTFDPRASWSADMLHAAWAKTAQNTHEWLRSKRTTTCVLTTRAATTCPTSF